MSQKKRPPLITVDAEHARDAWFRLMENARDLLLEAVLLRGSPRSISLLTLCMEEMSKGDSIWSLVSHTWDKPGYSGFGLLAPDDLRSHHVKLTEAVGMSAELGSFWGRGWDEFPTREEAEGVARRLNRRKLAAFYVDVEPDSVSSPTDLDLEGLDAEIQHVAQVLEKCLILENSRVQGLDGVDVDLRVHELHESLLPIAHPTLWRNE